MVVVFLIWTFAGFDADSVADGQQAAPEVRQWFNAQTGALTESVGAFPNAFFLPCLSTV